MLRFADDARHSLLYVESACIFGIGRDIVVNMFQLSCFEWKELEVVESRCLDCTFLAHRATLPRTWHTLASKSFETKA